MARYDGLTNPSKRAAVGIPYIVVIQSAQLDALATQMTMPRGDFAKTLGILTFGNFSRASLAKQADDQRYKTSPMRPAL